MKRYYTGVGSRNTPSNVLEIMFKLAEFLEKNNFILRTGDADGADKFFREGVSSLNNKIIFDASHAKDIHFDITKDIHPAWDRCSEYAKRLHTRNLYQVMGENLTEPAEFLICWTKGGKAIGGTRTAIMYAQNNNIPVFNLGDHEDLERLFKFLNKKYQIKI